MGIRNQNREILRRLDSRTLDARFLAEVEHGLNCSPFEAEAVLEVVEEVCFPFVDEHCVKAPPGKVTLVAVSDDEPAGKPVADCEKQSVCLTVHRGSQDDRIVQEQGPAGFRQARITEICQEALSQGALLTREDLAYRAFFVSPRTITRDLQFLRRAIPEVAIPLRSTAHDVGPVLTHRTQIVRLALEGKTMTEICTIMHHSPQAVSNDLSTFIRCAHLAQKRPCAPPVSSSLRTGRLVDLLRPIRNHGLLRFEYCGRAGLSHKAIICYRRCAEGKSPEQIAQETYHRLTAVDRYSGQFDRVRHCRQQGLTPMETAHILNCTLRLVEAYLRLDQELEAKQG